MGRDVRMAERGREGLAMILLSSSVDVVPLTQSVLFALPVCIPGDRDTTTHDALLPLTGLLLPAAFTAEVDLVHSMLAFGLSWLEA
jgi:hypothetical protein